jgi:hypothetical protein
MIGQNHFEFLMSVAQEPRAVEQDELWARFTHAGLAISSASNSQRVRQCERRRRFPPEGFSSKCIGPAIRNGFANKATRFNPLVLWQGATATAGRQSEQPEHVLS